jgi:hypothetical protein
LQLWQVSPVLQMASPQLDGRTTPSSGFLVALQPNAESRYAPNSAMTIANTRMA